MVASLCTLVLTGTPHVFAQEGISVMIQPSTIEEQVDPGQVIEGNLTITNENGGAQTYVISTRNITGMTDNGTPQFSDEYVDDPLEAAYWLEPLQKTVTMDVGESKQVPYRISVPADASPGGYFAAFFVTREAEQALESGAGVGFHVASLVSLRVKGEVFEDMQFKEFYTEGMSFFTEPKVEFKARLENSGTVHQRPLGIITIVDMFGKEVGLVRFNENGGAILPRFDRLFNTTWEHDGFALGRYTAIASVLIGEDKKSTLTREVSFWVLPLKEIGIVLGTLAVLLLLFIFGVKRYVRNVLKKAGKETLSKTKSQKISLARRMIRTISWLLALLVVLFIGMIVYSA